MDKAPAPAAAESCVELNMLELMLPIARDPLARGTPRALAQLSLRSFCPHVFGSRSRSVPWFIVKNRRKVELSIGILSPG
jgi:hypothetical protein